MSTQDTIGTEPTPAARSTPATTGDPQEQPLGTVEATVTSPALTGDQTTSAFHTALGADQTGVTPARSDDTSSLDSTLVAATFRRIDRQMAEIRAQQTSASLAMSMLQYSPTATGLPVRRALPTSPSEKGNPSDAAKIPLTATAEAQTARRTAAADYEPSSGIPRRYPTV